MWKSDKVFPKTFNFKQTMLKEYMHANFKNLRNQVICLHINQKVLSMKLFLKVKKNSAGYIYRTPNFISSNGKLFTNPKSIADTLMITLLIQGLQ